MIGAIAGDVIGSPYEFDRIKTTDFPLFSPDSEFTDDTVLTVALADSICTGSSYVAKLKEYYHRYPDCSYGGNFGRWARGKDSKPYNSFGNGSAMRVSPVGFAFDTIEDVLDRAKQSAEVTHNHPEGIKGAQATAACIFLARTGKSKDEIREYVETNFLYDLNRTVDEICPTYAMDGMDETCQGSVPESIICFLDSTDFEHCIRLAVSMGGDADTMACIAGGIAQAFYGEVPPEIKENVFKILDEPLASMVKNFCKKFNCE